MNLALVHLRHPRMMSSNLFIAANDQLSVWRLTGHIRDDDIPGNQNGASNCAQNEQVIFEYICSRELLGDTEQSD